MDKRVEQRKKDFKKTFDDPRRKREDILTQLRKASRDSHLNKKRQQITEQAVKAVSPQDLHNLVAMLMSNEPQANFESCQRFRRLLCIEQNPPIQQVLEAGVLPRLIEFLNEHSRPDLQFEAAWAVTNIASGSSEQTSLVIDHGAIPVLVKLLSSPKPDVREQAIWALGNIAGDCTIARDMVLRAGALQPLLTELQASDERPRNSLTRNGTWTLSNLCRGRPEPPFEWVKPALPVLRSLIYQSDTEILTDACWALSYLSDGSEEKATSNIDEVIKAGVAYRLVELLMHPAVIVQTPALRAVGNIVTGSDQQTQMIIMCGGLQNLVALLSSSRRALRKEACWTLSNITAGNKEQIQEVINSGAVPLLVDLLRASDFDIQKEAAWAISNAVSGGSPQQVQELVGLGVVKPLCDLLDKDDSKIVVVALEAIENILKVGKALAEQEASNVNNYVELLEVAGAFPHLEKLQYLPESSRAFDIAMRIMTTYLEADIETEPQVVVDGGFGAPPMGANFDFGGN